MRILVAYHFGRRLLYKNRKVRHTSRVWMSHVTHINQSCHTHANRGAPPSAFERECVISHNVTRMNEVIHISHPSGHVWMVHVTNINGQWVMSHEWSSHSTYSRWLYSGVESCHTYEWCMSHMWMSRVTHMDESCLTYEWVVSHMWMSHVTHRYLSCHTYEWGMAHIPKWGGYD